MESSAATCLLAALPTSSQSTSACRGLSPNREEMSDNHSALELKMVTKRFPLRVERLIVNVRCHLTFGGVVHGARAGSLRRLLPVERNSLRRIALHDGLLVSGYECLIDCVM